MALFGILINTTCLFRSSSKQLIKCEIESGGASKLFLETTAAIAEAPTFGANIDVTCAGTVGVSSSTSSGVNCYCETFSRPLNCETELAQVSNLDSGESLVDFGASCLSLVVYECVVASAN